MKRSHIVIGILIIAIFIFFLPKIVGAFQQTPTDYAANITGRLTSKITATQSTGITVTADTYRTPAGTAAVTWPTGNHILRVSRKAGNKTWVELIGVASASQSSSTVTLGTVTRYLSHSDGTDLTSQGDGLAFPSGSVVELIWSVQQAEQTMFKNNINVLTGSGRIEKTASGSASMRLVNVTTAERGSFEETEKGDLIYNETLGTTQVYDGANWLNLSQTGTTLQNAGFQNRGVVELATPAEILAATASGSATSLVPAVKDIVAQSSGSADSGKLCTLSGTGFLDSSCIARGNPTNDNTKVVTGSGWTTLTNLSVGSGANLDIDDELISDTNDLNSATFAQISSSLSGTMGLNVGDLLHMTLHVAGNDGTNGCTRIALGFQVDGGTVDNTSYGTHTFNDICTASVAAVTVSTYHRVLTGGTLTVQPVYRIQNGTDWDLACATERCAFQAVRIR